MNDFEVEDYERILTVIPDPHFYLVDFADIALLRRVLEATVDDPSVLVDNDNGVLLPGPEFLALLRAHPDWDWRLPTH